MSASLAQLIQRLWGTSMSSITSAANFVRLIVMSGRAIFHFTIGGLLLAFAVWLVLPSGSSWVLNVIAAYVGWKGLEVIGLGLEPFAGRPNAQSMAGQIGTAPGPHGNRAMRGREQGLSAMQSQRGRRY